MKPILFLTVMLALSLPPALAYSESRGSSTLAGLAMQTIGGRDPATAQVIDASELALQQAFVNRIRVLLKGGNVGGSGDVYVEQFVALADSILNRVKFEQQDKDLLQHALKTVQIITVEVLRNPDTGEMIPEQDQMVAWGTPGIIQLKEPSTKRDSRTATWGELLGNRSSVAHYLVHELYWLDLLTQGGCKKPLPAAMPLQHLAFNSGKPFPLRWCCFQ